METECDRPGIIKRSVSLRHTYSSGGKPVRGWRRFAAADFFGFPL